MGLFQNTTGQSHTMTSKVNTESDKPPSYTNGGETNQTLQQEPERPHKWVWSCCCDSKTGWTVWYSLVLASLIFTSRGDRHTTGSSVFPVPFFFLVNGSWHNAPCPAFLPPL